MRRMALITWLVLASAILCGGVWAAAVHRAKPRIALSGDIAALQPVEVFPPAAGRVVAVDCRDGKITVEHGPIRQFYLERMTGTFPVEDRTMLTGLTPGDKIRFDLQRQRGHYVITRIENSI
jgi:Cu(I)/Ag(I) efflux system protein CusF